MRRSGILAALAVALFGGGAAAQDAAKRPPLPGEWTLLFEDEFDREDPLVGGPGWIAVMKDGARSLNDELQTYVDRGAVLADGGRPGLHPFSIRDGVLSIAADRAPDGVRLEGRGYWSGTLSLENVFSFKYGYAEIRAAVPEGRGLWPAFWLMRSGPMTPYGEIDVTEVMGDDATVSYATVHAGADHRARRIFQIATTLPEKLSGGFHTYGVEWTERSVTFYLDGVIRGWMSTPDELKAPMYPIVNLAVGGLAGAPDAGTKFPAIMRVDYVRIWRSAPKSGAK